MHQISYYPVKADKITEFNRQYIVSKQHNKVRNAAKNLQENTFH